MKKLFITRRNVLGPEGNPDLWTKEEVRQHLKSVGLHKYKDDLKIFNGRLLLKLDKTDVSEIVDAADVEAFCSMLGQLRVSRLGYDDRKLSSPRSPRPAQQQALRVKPDYSNGIGSPRSPGRQGCVVVEEKFVPEQANPLGDEKSKSLIQGFAVAADVPGDDLLQYLNVHSQGGHLAETAALNPAFRETVEAVFQLHHLAANAVVNKVNCDKVSGFAMEVLKTLDMAAKLQLNFEPDFFGQVTDAVTKGRALFLPLVKSGWLLELVCNQKWKEGVEQMHDRLAELFRNESLDHLPGNRPLGKSEYKDVVRIVRKFLKQLGAGDVTNGLRVLKEADKADSIRELAEILEVTVPEVAAEVQSLPDLDVDVDTLFYNVSDPNSNKQQQVFAMVSNMFEWYDSNRNGVIELSELHSILADLGFLDGKTNHEAKEFVREYMKVSDMDGDGVLDHQEFCAVCSTFAMTKARQQLRMNLGMPAEDHLRKIFGVFSGTTAQPVGTELDGAHFIKLCRDCNLLSKNLSAVDIDMIFAQVKSKGHRKLNFDQFLSSLLLCADRKGVEFEEMVKQIIATGGPIFVGTKADSVRLYDDKSSYTGVYAKGGPSVCDPSRDLSSLVQRQDVKKHGSRSNSSSKQRPASPGRRGASPSPVLSKGSTGPRKSTTPSRDLLAGYNGNSKYRITDDSPPAPKAIFKDDTPPRPPAIKVSPLPPSGKQKSNGGSRGSSDGGAPPAIAASKRNSTE